MLTSLRSHLRSLPSIFVLVFLAIAQSPLGSAADERTDRLKDGIRAGLDRPGVKAPFPCDDGWLGSGEYVVDVTDWAEAAGLRRGDRFIAMGGVSVANAGHWTDALSKATPEKTLEITVDRQGREITLSLPCRDNREWWRTQRNMFEAAVAERWGDCISGSRRLLQLARRPFSFMLQAQVDCWSAELRAERSATVPKDFWLLLHQLANQYLEESRYRPGLLASRRPFLLNTIKTLEDRGFKLQADDLRNQLQTTTSAAASPSRLRPEAVAPEDKVGYRFGTAFAVRPDGLLMTAHHVVQGADRIVVFCPEVGRLRAAIETSSATTDLALLRVEGGLPREYLSFGDPKAASIGTRVFTIGYPAPSVLGGDPKFTEGSISSLSGLGGDASLYQISVPVQGGNSGGPLVTEGGAVVGVVIATASASGFFGITGNLPQNINWAVKGTLASALFEAPQRVSLGTDRASAIQKVTRATCLVIVEAHEKGLR